MGKKVIVGFSGGADSQATALLARQQHPAEDVILLNADPGGNEHPLTSQFIRDYSANVFPVTVVQPIIADLGGSGTKEGYAPKERRDQFADADALTFERLAFIKGRFPSRTRQFCTTFLKLAPAKRWIDARRAELGEFERWSGVRRQESQRRAKTPLYSWDDWFECLIRFPVATWTKQDVFEFLAKHGEEVNPLYKLGFSRVGCAPCINSGKDDVREWACRFPEIIEKVRAWERSVGRTFFPPIVPGMRINWVDDVVQWSRTARGGRQPLLPFVEADAAAGSCVSQYGLCE